MRERLIELATVAVYEKAKHAGYEVGKDSVIADTVDVVLRELEASYMGPAAWANHMRQVLEPLEWAGAGLDGEPGPHCPDCHEPKAYGEHNDSCGLAELLDIISDFIEKWSDDAQS